MRKSIQLFILILIIPFLQFCQAPQQNNTAYNVNARISGLDNGMAYLIKLDLSNNEQVIVDSSIIVDGNFQFSGNLNSPYIHSIFINDNSNKIHFFLENSQIEISGNMDKLDEINITGSKEDSLFRSYTIEDIFDRKRGMEIMLSYPDYTFAAFTAFYQFQTHNIHADTMETIVLGFSEKVKASTYFIHLEKLYSTVKNVAISKKAPNFSIQDTNNVYVSLSEFNGKYVLIDFWASWCAPCRAANHHLKEVYNRYNSNEFEIIGISVDKDRKQWIKAINNDGLHWTNLSNLQGWDSISEIYGVKAVPQNFLLNPDAIIIDKNIEPEKLMDKLEELLPDYSIYKSQEFPSNMQIISTLSSIFTPLPTHPNNGSQSGWQNPIYE